MQARLHAITGEAMTGVDTRAQRYGVPGDQLMEEAGTATAAAARALMISNDRPTGSLVLILCGPATTGAMASSRRGGWLRWASAPRS